VSARAALIALLSIEAVVLAACVDLEPDVGDPARPRCADVDSDPDTDVSFRVDIEGGVFAGACRDCHSSGGANPIGVRVSGLSLGSYSALRSGGDESGADIVVPGMPCASILVQKVGEAPPFGARMPLDGPPFLTAEQVQLIADWIAEGADDD
jgi:Planctomycete cytochrome C